MKARGLRQLGRGLSLGLATALLAAPTAPGASENRASGNRASENSASAVVATPGGHRMGNPQAPTSLVMFVSYSCPHCAEFEQAASRPLQSSVNSGRVSVEVRHVIRNAIDLAAALATECGPPDGFFARHNAMLEQQAEWLATAMVAGPDRQQRWINGSPGERMKAIAGDLDFYGLVQAEGVERAALDTCLADEARARHIVTTAREQSRRFAIAGTPSFLVNGRLLPEVHSWPALEEALDAKP